MKYDVTLTINITEEDPIDGLYPLLERTQFAVDVASTGDGQLVLQCRGIEAQGFNSLPEALRKAQVGLSPLFREALPRFKELGGLLWSDITAADVRAVQ